MEANRDLASWLLSNRLEIDRVMNGRLGAAAPAPSGPESETLRRFRTFTATALMRGEAPRPVLEGLRPNERRVMALLTAWTDAAAGVAGERGDDVRQAVGPLLDAFRLAIRASAPGRRSKGTPRASRRTVVAAIDRVSDSFLAIDVDTGQIVDANPAAGALLGVARDALIGLEISAFCPQNEQARWLTLLDSLAEGEDSRICQAWLSDHEGKPFRIEATLTRYATRGRTLALMLARPQQVVAEALHLGGATAS